MQGFKAVREVAKLPQGEASEASLPRKEGGHLRGNCVQDLAIGREMDGEFPESHTLIISLKTLPAAQCNIATIVISQQERDNGWSRQHQME